MANTLTPLIPSIIASVQEVARELAPIQEIVTLDSTLEGAALNQSITIPATVPVSGTNITPGATAPGGSDMAPGSVTLSMTKARAFPFTLTGEDYQRMASRGPEFRSQQIQEAVRACVGEMFADILAIGAQGAGYAIGSQGTNPFASNTDSAADIKKSLDDGLAPASGRSLLIDSTTDAALGKLGINNQVYQAGTDSILRTGEKLPLQGIRLPLASTVYSHTKGTGTGYLVNNVAGYAAGTTVITVDTGSNTIVAGDVLTFAGHTTKYIAKSLSGTTLTLNSPLVAAVANDEAITVGNSGTRLLALAKPGIMFATRAPALPAGGDIARGRTSVFDPITGLTFSIAHYVEAYQEKFLVEAVWGGGVVRPNWVRQVLSN